MAELYNRHEKKKAIFMHTQKGVRIAVSVVEAMVEDPEAAFFSAR